MSDRTAPWMDAVALDPALFDTLTHACRLAKANGMAFRPRKQGKDITFHLFPGKRERSPAQQQSAEALLPYREEIRTILLAWMAWKQTQVEEITEIFAGAVCADLTCGIVFPLAPARERGHRRPSRPP